MFVCSQVLKQMEEGKQSLHCCWQFLAYCFVVLSFLAGGCKRQFLLPYLGTIGFFMGPIPTLRSRLQANVQVGPSAKNKERTSLSNFLVFFLGGCFLGIHVGPVFVFFVCQAKRKACSSGHSKPAVKLLPLYVRCGCVFLRGCPFCGGLKGKPEGEPQCCGPPQQVTDIRKQHLIQLFRNRPSSSEGYDSAARQSSSQGRAVTGGY